MTDEEKAEEYVKEQILKHNKEVVLRPKNAVTYIDELKQVYLDGLAELEKENAELIDKLNLQNQRLNELIKENAELKEQIEKMKCCHNCKNCEINFTKDSGIKYGCKKLRHKSDDCILHNYYHWELAE